MSSSSSSLLKKRPNDIRSSEGLRSIDISFDGLARVDGSARFAFGSTKALASVSGPIEVRVAAEQASKATLEVIVRPLGGVPATKSKSLSSTIRTILAPSIVLTHSPRSLIQIVAQALSPPLSQRPISSLSSPPSSSSTNDPLSSTSTPQTTASANLPRIDPSQEAALLNASTLALLNASSVPMLGVICAVALGRQYLHDTQQKPTKKSTPKFILDPSPEDWESGRLDAGGVFAFMHHGSVISISKDTSDSDTLERSTSEADLIWCSYRMYSRGASRTAPISEAEIQLATEAARRASRAVLREFENALSLHIRGGGKDKGRRSGDGFKVALGKLKGEALDAMDTA